MLSSKDFWVGVLVGVILCYVYRNYMSKKGPGQ